MTDITLPTLPVVLGTALIDSINPCAIGVLVFMAATLMSLTNDRRRMLWIGSIYVLTVFVTYLAAGFGLLFFIQRMAIAEEVGLVVGGVVIVMGLIEMKDYFWEGKGISLQIPAKQAKKIKKYVQNASVPGAIFLGFFVAAVELPCTGGPYLAITTLLARAGFSADAFGLLALYNFIFVLPLLVILLLVYFGTGSDKIKEWKNEKKKWMRLWMGVVMVLLGLLLVLWSTGVISFTLG